MPSFDIVSQVDRQEVKNAVEQTNKEITNRFDFKGSDARVEQNELVLTVYAATNSSSARSATYCALGLPSATSMSARSSRARSRRSRATR